MVDSERMKGKKEERRKTKKEKAKGFGGRGEERRARPWL